MDRDRVEEAFDHDDRGRLRGDRSMQVEENQRFAEAGRKPILRVLVVDGAAGVRDQLPGCIVNRDDDPPATKSLSVVQAPPKRADTVRRYTARRQVWVRGIDVVKREAQR
jgi:hypothetical protein